MTSNFLTVPYFKSVEIKPYSECALLLIFKQAPIADIHRLAQLLNEVAKSWGIVDIVPAYDSLMIVCENDSQRYYVQDQLSNSFDSKNQTRQEPNEQNAAHLGRLIEIPVCYDPCLGPDLESLAQTKSITTEELITLHATPEYLVCMLGFVPGFMYLSGLNEALSAPRLDKPRTDIAAGSVAIGANQTGIYPFDMPGGWQIIGRTPLLLNNLKTMQFGVAEPMDRIKFIPISLAEFNRTNQND
jgi:inhibitor of KinA